MQPESAAHAGPESSGPFRVLRGESLERKQRLVSSRLFDEAYSQRRKFAGRFMVLFLREGEGAVRLNVIATQMGLPRQSIEMFESDFIRLGLISKSEKGRMLTARGHEHLAVTTG